MTIFKFKWLIPGITAILICLKAENIMHNILYVHDLHVLFQCTQNQNIADLWANLPTYNSYCPLNGKESATIADVAAIISWSDGKSVPIQNLDAIHIPWKKELFIWRNTYQASPVIISEVGYTLPELASFFTNLASWAWLRGFPEQTIYFAQLALKVQPTQKIADRLESGINVRKNADLATVTEVHRMIARSIPDNSENYRHWFEIMLSYKDWTSATEACHGMQQASPSLSHTADGLICEARIKFFQGDYSGALAQLAPISEQFPQNPTVLTWQGITLKQMGRYIEAKGVLQKAIASEQDTNTLLNLYWLLGDCLFALGEIPQAHTAYQFALYNDNAHRYQQELKKLIIETQ